MRQSYDLIIIGAGPGGYVAAKKAAQLGRKVLIVDKGELGGTCINRGCIPTKALIHASTLYRDIKECENFGLTTGEIGFQFSKIHEYKELSSKVMRENLEIEFAELGITFIKGNATIQADKNVRIVGKDGELVAFSAPRILIATGAKANMPDVEGIDLDGVVTSEELLKSNNKLCKSLLILGGGVIGLELATAFNALGTKVTVIELADRLIPALDIEFSKGLEDVLGQREIDIYKASTIEKIIKNDEEGLTCVFQHQGIVKEIGVESILVSIGRKANTNRLFDEDVLIERERGRLVVDDFFQTSIQGIYAIGDVIEGVQLAHVAAAQATYVVERMHSLEPSVMLSIVPSGLFVSMSIIPNCLYTNPEIASVGITEEEARKKGVRVRCGLCQMNKNSQSILSKEESGFIKVVFSADSDVLLGAQMMCKRATDMIGELATAIANGLTSRQLMYAMRAQPTFNEAISVAVERSRESETRW